MMKRTILQQFRLRLFLEGIATGLAAGLSVAFYRWLIARAEMLRATLYEGTLLPTLASGQYLPLAGWILFLAAAGLLLAWAGRFEPMARGSGIPQVKGVLRGVMTMRWARVLFVQIAGGALGIGCGLSLGHAGPAVQIGAAAAQGTSRAMSRRPLEERFLITSGAGAGLSAVFNAPLTGMVFALEALRRRFSPAILLPALTAAVTAAVVIRLAFGQGTIFLFQDIQPTPIAHLPYVILLAAVTGAAAVPFNAGLLHMDRFYHLPCFPTPASRILFALAAAALLGFCLPGVLGGGDALVNAVITTGPLFSALAVLLIGKWLFTLVSFGSGVPGGFFFPSLVIGALVGAVTGSLLIQAGLLPPVYLTNMMIFTMAAFFAGTVRAPVTGAILLLEMTGSFQHLLPLVLAVGTAYIVSGLLGGRPIYDELLEKQLGNKKY